MGFSYGMSTRTQLHKNKTKQWHICAYFKHQKIVCYSEKYNLLLSPFIYTTEENSARKEDKIMLKTRFGIEIEFTGITRKKTASVIAKYFNNVIREDLLK